MTDASLAVVSHFSTGRESDASLEALLHQLKSQNIQIVVVCNASWPNQSLNYSSLSSLCLDILERPNEGMNIGAWRFGYQAYPNFSIYHFLQSECFIRRDDFRAVYERILQSKDVGIVGESMNLKWDQTWSALEGSALDCDIYVQPGFYGDGAPLDRVRSGKMYQRIAYYRSKFRQWSCEGNSSLLHLRALNWSFNVESLRKIDFPVGFSKHECIAAEIYVSRSLASKGLKIVQASSEPFFYVGHPEWMAHRFCQRKQSRI